MKPEELKKIRKERDLDQRAMAQYLGASYSALTKWETGANPIPKWVDEKLKDKRKGFGVAGLSAKELAQFEAAAARRGTDADSIAAELIRSWLRIGLFVLFAGGGFLG